MMNYLCRTPIFLKLLSIFNIKKTFKKEFSQLDFKWFFTEKVINTRIRFSIFL